MKFSTFINLSLLLVLMNVFAVSPFGNQLINKLSGLNEEIDNSSRISTFKLGNKTENQLQKNKNTSLIFQKRVKDS